MKAVNIAELKNRLSYYLRMVRRGEAILVRDRRRVVARIEPAGDRDAGWTEDREWLSALEARGILRPARVKIDADLLAHRPKVDADVVGALLAEREEGR